MLIAVIILFVSRLTGNMCTVPTHYEHIGIYLGSYKCISLVSLSVKLKPKLLVINPTVSGTDVMIFKIFSPKNYAKILAIFLLKLLLLFAKI
jgi:hypothetical protein